MGRQSLSEPLCRGQADLMKGLIGTKALRCLRRDRSEEVVLVGKDQPRVGEVQLRAPDWGAELGRVQ